MEIFMMSFLTTQVIKHGFLTLSSLLTLGYFATAAQAEILLATSRSDPAIYGGAAYVVDFNGGAAGGDVLSFSTSQPNTKVVITFNAECAVSGTSFNWLDIDVLVNPAGPTGEAAVAPSNSDNALCSGNATDSDFLYGGGDGWVSATTQATLVLPQAGNHTVRVLVNGAGASTLSRLDDMSLVIQR
jgi:hypothetical protein